MEANKKILSRQNESNRYSYMRIHTYAYWIDFMPVTMPDTGEDTRSSKVSTATAFPGCNLKAGEKCVVSSGSAVSVTDFTHSLLETPEKF